jgi:hypothetical protein
MVVLTEWLYRYEIQRASMSMSSTLGRLCNPHPLKQHAEEPMSNSPITLENLSISASDR